MSRSTRIILYDSKLLIQDDIMETTLNIHVDILEIIKREASLKNISNSKLIHFLIQKVAEDIGDPGTIGRMVKYQDRHKPEEWHFFHIQVREDVYEYWLDLKKLLKMSLSLILAYALKKYLKEKLKIINTDNNRFNSYIITKEIIDNVIVWKYIWGIPPNLEKVINFNYSEI
jgi:hypothetical protein